MQMRCYLHKLAGLCIGLCCCKGFSHERVLAMIICFISFRAPLAFLEASKNKLHMESPANGIMEGQNKGGNKALLHLKT
ncbi:hypothetical protein MA16_Dca025640 [Dendrobium catenatum]|uniref:Uncharacterized protein n=1 Tax=Dendrobium catenatum TaxID=906689 RepID=A0A2I0WKE9_9ASPA|nr:hypothetical protein MA16_Dca025640 [Dendrobium catenatum]